MAALNEDAIFDVARQIGSQAARDAYLKQACEGNDEVRARLDQLLAAHEAGDSRLDNPPFRATISHVAPQDPEGEGVQIGPYKLRERLGEGGMGVVWAAEQKRPLRRKVALKVIKPGMDSKAVIARFEAERQALAAMDHPNIARVLDAGTTEAGRPYFVMELVRGIAITDYCDQHKLDIRQRLEIFASICQAIQHAHQKGIIHRDIKPSNVLVTEIDGKAVPKLIDFGIAKALHGNLTDRTVYTCVHSVVGTTMYMSPEQAALSGVDVDTRSDVYSLGALLYELVTGVPPFEEQRLREIAIDEICRIIREEDPPKPSTRIGSLRHTASSISTNRRTEPAALGRFVRGDLDWIIMKTLEKERSRRYDTAASLAADVNRFLQDEAIVARPPSTTYRFGKFAKRNKMPLIAVTLLVTSLVVGMIMFYLQNRTLQSLLERYQDEIVQNAFAAAVGGDEAGLGQALSDAEKAGVEELEIGKLRGFASLFDGHEADAVRELSEVVTETPHDIGAWALLFCACRYSGDLDAYARAEAELRRLSASNVELSAIDRLFVGFAESETHVLIPQGVEKLRSVVQEKPAWAIGRVFLAQALSNLAVDTREESVLSEAVQELNVSRALMPENPFVTAVGLKVHTVALVDAIESNSSETSCSESAAEYANELFAKYPDYLYGRITRARYFAAIDDPVMALAEWKTARKHGGGGLVDSCIVCLQTRIGDAAYRQKDAIASAWQGVLLGNRKETLRLVDIQETTSVLGRLWSNGYICRLCGEDRGTNVVEEIDQSPIAKPKWLENPLRLFVGKVSPEQLLTDLKHEPSSRFWTAHTHFCVAMEFLYRDDPDKAEKHLQECIRANSWETDFHHAAIGFLNRLQKGDDWPASLRVAE